MTKREKRAAKAAARDTGGRRRRGTGGPGPTRGRRDPVPVVLVVAEGEKTEIDYLAWLNRRRREVRIDAYSKFNSPEQVVQHALDRRALLAQRVDAVSEVAQHALDGRPSQVLRGRVGARQPAERAGGLR